MIYFTPGITQSYWFSLRESMTYGSTASFAMTLTNDVSGATKSFYPTDLQPDNKWSRFSLVVGKPQNLSIGKLDLSPGMWSYSISAGITTLETGKAIVEEVKVWNTLDRPDKNKVVLRR